MRTTPLSASDWGPAQWATPRSVLLRGPRTGRSSPRRRPAAVPPRASPRGSAPRSRLPGRRGGVSRPRAAPGRQGHGRGLGSPPGGLPGTAPSPVLGAEDLTAAEVWKRSFRKRCTLTEEAPLGQCAVLSQSGQHGTRTRPRRNFQTTAGALKTLAPVALIVLPDE